MENDNAVPCSMVQVIVQVRLTISHIVGTVIETSFNMSQVKTLSADL